MIAVITNKSIWEKVKSYLKTLGRKLFIVIKLEKDTRRFPSIWVSQFQLLFLLSRSTRLMVLSQRSLGLEERRFFHQEQVEELWGRLMTIRNWLPDIQSELAASGTGVSISTIGRVLHGEGFSGRRPRKKPLLGKCHKDNHSKIAKRHLNDEYEFWSKVLWSDETKIELFGHAYSRYVWRKSGEAYKEKNTIPTVKHGGGNILLWEIFSV